MSGVGAIVVAGLALGLGAGVLSGMFGIGGGLVIVPALILFFHETPKTAVGTSLFALMWPVGLLGVIEYWKTGHMKVLEGLCIAVGLFIGAYFGARITLNSPTTTMKRLYAVFLLVVGVYFLYTTRSTPAAKPSTSTSSSSPASVTESDEGPAQVH